MAKKKKKATKAKKKKSVARKSVARKAVKKKTGKKRKSGLTQMICTVSDELQDIVKSKKLTRPEIVKKLWVYIKAHKCQDTKNKRLINPDAKLAKVLGSRPIDMLKLAGCISKHIES